MPDGHVFEAIVTLGEGAVECVPQPLVRCRDCTHFRENLMYGDSHTWCEEAPHFGRLVPPDGFCHRGERRADA